MRPITTLNETYFEEDSCNIGNVTSDNIQTSESPVAKKLRQSLQVLSPNSVFNSKTNANGIRSSFTTETETKPSARLGFDHPKISHKPIEIFSNTQDNENCQPEPEDGSAKKCQDAKIVTNDYLQ